MAPTRHKRPHPPPPPASSSSSGAQAATPTASATTTPPAAGDLLSAALPLIDASERAAVQRYWQSLSPSQRLALQRMKRSHIDAMLAVGEALPLFSQPSALSRLAALDAAGSGGDGSANTGTSDLLSTATTLAPLMPNAAAAHNQSHGHRNSHGYYNQASVGGATSASGLAPGPLSPQEAAAAASMVSEHASCPHCALLHARLKADVATLADDVDLALVAAGAVPRGKPKPSRTATAATEKPAPAKTTTPSQQQQLRAGTTAAAAAGLLHQAWGPATAPIAARPSLAAAYAPSAAASSAAAAAGYAPTPVPAVTAAVYATAAASAHPLVPPAPHHPAVAAAAGVACVQHRRRQRAARDALRRSAGRPSHRTDIARVLRLSGLAHAAAAAAAAAGPLDEHSANGHTTTNDLTAVDMLFDLPNVSQLVEQVADDIYDNDGSAFLAALEGIARSDGPSTQQDARHLDSDTQRASNLLGVLSGLAPSPPPPASSLGNGKSALLPAPIDLGDGYTDSDDELFSEDAGDAWADLSDEADDEWLANDAAWLECFPCLLPPPPPPPPLAPSLAMSAAQNAGDSDEPHGALSMSNASPLSTVFLGDLYGTAGLYGDETATVPKSNGNPIWHAQEYSRAAAEVMRAKHQRVNEAVRSYSSPSSSAGAAGAGKRSASGHDDPALLARMAGGRPCAHHAATAAAAGAISASASGYSAAAAAASGKQAAAAAAAATVAPTDHPLAKIAARLLATRVLQAYRSAAAETAAERAAAELLADEEAEAQRRAEAKRRRAEAVAIKKEQKRVEREREAAIARAAQEDAEREADERKAEREEKRKAEREEKRKAAAVAREAERVRAAEAEAKRMAEREERELRRAEAAAAAAAAAEAAAAEAVRKAAEALAAAEAKQREMTEAKEAARAAKQLLEREAAAAAVAPSKLQPISTAARASAAAAAAATTIRPDSGPKSARQSLERPPHAAHEKRIKSATSSPTRGQQQQQQHRLRKASQDSLQAVKESFSSSSPIAHRSSSASTKPTFSSPAAARVPSTAAAAAPARAAAVESPSRAAPKHFDNVITPSLGVDLPRTSPGTKSPPASAPAPAAQTRPPAQKATPIPSILDAPPFKPGRSWHETFKAVAATTTTTAQSAPAEPPLQPMHAGPDLDASGQPATTAYPQYPMSMFMYSVPPPPPMGHPGMYAMPMPGAGGFGNQLFYPPPPPPPPHGMPMVPFDPNHPPPLPPYGMPGVTHFPVMGPNGRPMLVSARPDGLPPYPAALTSTAASSTLTALGAGSGGDIGSGGARFDDQLDPITTAALAGHERGTSSASTIGDATNAAAAGGAFGPDFGIGAEAWGMSLVTNGSDGFSGDGMSPLSPFSSHRTALHMHQQPPMADQGLQSPPPASMMHSPLHALHLGGGGSNGGCTGVVAASGGNGNGSTSTGGNGGTSTPPASTAAAAAAAAKSIWSPFGPDLFDDIRSAAATTATANAPPSGGPGGTASSAVSSASSSSNNGNGHLASPEGTSAFWGGAGSRVPSGPRSAGLADLFSRSPLDSDLGSIEPAAPATDAFGFAPLGNPSTLSSGGKPLPPTHVGMQAIGSRDHGIAPRLRAASASMPRTATRWSESLSGAIASAAPASSSPAFVSAGATPVSHSRFGPLQPLGPMPASTEPSALLGSRFASIGVMGGGGGSESNDYRR